MKGALARGAERIRTAVEGFADLCLATRPQRQKMIFAVKVRTHLLCLTPEVSGRLQHHKSVRKFIN